MTCTACGEHPKENTAKGFPKAVVEINNPETLVLLRKVVIPASMGDETAFPPAIGKYFNVLLHYEASGSNYLYSSDGIPTAIGANIPQEVLDRIEALEDGYDDLAEDYEQLQSEVGDVSEALSAETSARELADSNLQAQVGAVSEALSAETSARENADIGLQGQIDAITSSSDVKDIVGTYTELQNYDTSTLGNDDIIKVLQDSTHNNAMTYYRWIISGGAGSWQYIGEEGPYYTKSETETLLNNKQDEITSSNKLLSDLVDDTNQTNKFVTENEKTTWNTEIENLQEEDELLKRNLYKAFPTDTASGAVASFTDGADNLPLKSLIVNIDPIQDTSQGDPSPENICPISGWSEANVTRTGKNIVETPCPTGSTRNDDGSVTRTATSVTGGLSYFYTDMPSGTYTISNISGINLFIQSASGDYSTKCYVGASKTFTHVKGEYGRFLTENQQANTTATFKWQVELGNEPTTYEPYNATTYSITFPAAAGTVYGGTVDLVSGLLTINRTTVNTTWGSGTNATNLGHVTRKRFNLGNPSKKYYTDAGNDLKSNVIGQYDTLYSGDYVHMYLASTTHIWAYMPSNTAADTVMQFSYTLETPVTYQLTPTEVNTLLGVNNIWADTGDTEVEYRADTKLYINKMIGDAENNYQHSIVQKLKY